MPSLSKTSSFRNFAGSIHDYAKLTGLTYAQLQNRAVKSRKAVKAVKAVKPIIYDFFKTKAGRRYLAETTAGFDAGDLMDLRKHSMEQVSSIHKIAYYTGYMSKLSLELDINKGDILLGGRFKNQRVEVKDIGTDELGQPTINGKKLLSFRIEKKLPEKKKSRKTQEQNKTL